MATKQLNGFMERLRRAALVSDGCALSDGQLLECFVNRREEAAFEAIVRRHSRMVWGVCRRLLPSRHDAEDAFQATFLVLVRKAASLAQPELLGNWLYGVAYRAALEVRGANAMRRTKERSLRDVPEPAACATESCLDLRPLIDRELSWLPEKYRVLIVLCDLEGRRRKEVARQLAIAEGTLSSRLATARTMLAKRLARHGVALSGAAVATALAQNAAWGCVPGPLVISTVQAAASIAAGTAVASAVSVQVAALAKGVMKSMILAKLSLTAGLLGPAFVLGASLIFGQFSGQENQPREKPAAQGTDESRPKGSQTENSSPKAGRIFYHRNLSLVTIEPKGRKPKDLAKMADKDLWGYQIHSARLSPDGKRLAFGKSVQKEENGMHVVSPPNTIFLRDVDKTAEAEPVVEMDGMEFNNWVWSPDGKKLAVVSWDSQHLGRNWIVDVKTGKSEEVKLPRFKVKDKEYSLTIQAWSPDGAWFLAAGKGLYLVKSDLSQSRRLTEADKGIFGGSCRFSPDGQKVLFVGFNKDKSMTLYVVEVSSGRVRTVVEAKNFGDMQACWSPDSRRIAYCTTLLDAQGNRQGETSLFVVDADGSNTVTVLTEKHRPNEIRLRLTDWR